MAESEAITADGMSFSYRTSAAGVTPKVWAEIGEVATVTPPNPTKESVDVTHLKSPNKTREHRPTIKEPGESGILLNYTPAARVILDTLFDSDDVQEFQIGYPDAATETFFGFLMGKATEGAEVAGKLTLNAPIKVTGLPVYEEPA